MIRPGPALALLLLAACSTCPPAWVEHVPVESGWRYAAGSSREVFVEADARDVALGRATRRLAEALQLDVERRLSVTWADGRLFVEAIGPDGPLHDLDALELVDQAECEGTTWVLVRIPRP
jgi:hypothetical protein